MSSPNLKVILFIYTLVYIYTLFTSSCYQIGHRCRSEIRSPTTITYGIDPRFIDLRGNKYLVTNVVPATTSSSVHLGLHPDVLLVDLLVAVVSRIDLVSAAAAADSEAADSKAVVVSEVVSEQD